MRQRQDLDPSQYLAGIFISFEELQNGGTRDRERKRERERNRGKKMKSKGLVKDEFMCGGRKHHFVVRLQVFVSSSFWYY